VSPRLIAVLVVVLVVLVGVFALALAGTITGESALQFASTVFAAFLGAVVGNQLLPVAKS
jgi:membrane protein DedA with SNARE-associated domain